MGQGKTQKENSEMRQLPIKRVSARGKRYAYIRGTDIAIVQGLVGTAEQFEGAIANALRERGIDHKSTVDGFRMDAAKVLHRGAMARAREFGRSYTLSARVIGDMLAAARDRCVLTGIEFDYHAGRLPDGSVRPLAPSLDRIDNRLGYDAGNVRLVCTSVNIALNVWGVENFERVCRAFLRNLENRRAQIGKQNEPCPVIFSEINAVT